MLKTCITGVKMHILQAISRKKGRRNHTLKNGGNRKKITIIVREAVTYFENHKNEPTQTHYD